MAGRITLKTTNWLKCGHKLLKALFDQFTYLNTMFTELFADTTVTYYIPTHASRTVYNLFIARRGYTVTSIDYVPDVAQGSALTACVVKVTGTATPSNASTPMQASTTGINLNGTAHTVQSISLTTVAADLVLAAGNRIGLQLSGALSTGAGLLTIRMSKT